MLSAAPLPNQDDCTILTIIKSHCQCRIVAKGGRTVLIRVDRGQKGSLQLRMSSDGRTDFSPVPLEEALIEPDGFYARLNAVNPSKRRVILIRLPTDVKDAG